MMKACEFELPNGKNTLLNSYKRAILPLLTLVLLASISLYQYNISASTLQSLGIHIDGSDLLAEKDSSSLSPEESPRTAINNSGSMSGVGECDMFSGDWVLNGKGPCYTNETNCVIDDRQNCMKYGRPDTEFLKWRWKPDDCDLPLFDAVRFLELVRGKTLAFVGDSVGRNQMQSLVCLLASVASPKDVTGVDDTKFRRWLYTDFNFTIVALWSPLLVKSQDEAPNGYSHTTLMKLYLDKPDEAWVAQVETADIVIISAGHWFFRTFMLYENGKLVGCSACHKENVTDLGYYYAYRMAYRTVFRTLLSLRNYKGLTVLRTFSPSHFENGDWDKGGQCVRTRPFGKEVKLEWYAMQMYSSQVEELRAAETEGKGRGLKFRLLDSTAAMGLRPDGHPNHYGHWPHENQTMADCVHWCLPGPIDTWNEFLLQMLRMEGENEQANEKLQKHS